MATRSTLTPTSALPLLLIVYGLFSVSFCNGIDVVHPRHPTPIYGSSQGSKHVELCERVPVHGISRMKLQSYAKAYRVMLVPSVSIPDKLHNKIQICFHRNASLGLCQCEKDDWRFVQKGLWSSVMSPYDQRFVDVKLVDGVSGSVTVTLDEVCARSAVSQDWRYVLLAVGSGLLFLAPVDSKWVPFYYTSSMAIGVLAVIIILLYQGMKLLPTGRKVPFILVCIRHCLVRDLFLFITSQYLSVRFCQILDSVKRCRTRFRYLWSF